MSVDIAGILYGMDSPIYAAIGVAARLIDNDGTVFDDLSVIDETSGVEVDIGGDAAVNTIKPACFVRQVELSQRGISVSGLKGSQITFSGKTWAVENKLPRPSPSGEDTGELMLILVEADE